MKLYIKNMVSIRCKLIVKSELQKLGIHFAAVDIGEVEIMEALSAEQHENLNSNLMKTGLSLINDKKSILIEKIKNIIVYQVYFAEKLPKTNFSDYLSEQLDYDYTYMANLFSENQNTSIEQYIINLKIERVKELLIYDELNLSEIADKLHYRSLSHLSSQFKKITGLTPSNYKNLRHHRRKPIENV
jgi:AraC-like DNA-binding protein